jgi:hypothetical protein
MYWACLTRGGPFHVRPKKAAHHNPGGWRAAREESATSWSHDAAVGMVAWWGVERKDVRPARRAFLISLKCHHAQSGVQRGIVRRQERGISPPPGLSIR